MLKIFEYLKYNIKFIILSFSLVSEAIVVIPSNKIIYYVGIIYLFYYALKNNSYNKFGTLFILFLISCLISSCLALTFDYRLFFFALFIISCTPITDSFKIYVFRKKYLYYCLMIFPILAIASLFCYFLDINYYANKNTHIVNTLDFSAFFPHPMWLGTALGLSNIVLIWLLFNTKRKIYIFILSILLLLSIYLSIIAASRSAFFASIAIMIVFTIIKLHNLKKITLASIIMIVITIALLPFYISGAKRMQNKFAESHGDYGSRTELFVTGLSRFIEHPVWGQGFAVGYDTKKEKEFVGRMETGSGWLSILTQMGLAGGVLVFILLLNVRKIFPYLLADNELLLFFCSFLYLCFHSCFEGYLLTIGYYPCILFWVLLGYFHVYPYYKEKELRFLKYNIICEHNKFPDL